jgi:hypothetical protein
VRGLPEHIADALGEIKPIHPALRQVDEECQGAKYHSPAPLLVEEVQIGPGRWVTLCGTCRDNLKVYEDLKGHFNGEIPWSVRREFGNQLRSIGDVAE